MLKKFLAVLLLLLLCAPSALAYRDPLEGFDLGDTWFGEDFAYDITDESACWELLQRPITVLDAGETEKIYPRKEPNGKRVNNDYQGGFIMGASSAVHVLEEDTDGDGWLLIEGMDYYNRVIRGYVKASLIKTVTPNEKYGIIVDKLTQRMYVFVDGALYSTLAVSTGKPSEEHEYNETSAGEYLIMSWTGTLTSEDNMYCEMAMRYNGGDMIHEVPHSLRADGSDSYRVFETHLGQKASHGCIRTQRALSEEGVNAEWLWDHLKKYTKVVIWDDRNRVKPYPDEDEVVYYNPIGGARFHADPNCSSVNESYLPLTPMTYGELETAGLAELTFCPYCQPQDRISSVAADNLERGVISRQEYEEVVKPLAYPEDDFVVYYNPAGGSHYHSTANCPGVKERYLPLSPLAYGDLEKDKFASLTPCETCVPVPRKEKIDKLNLKRGYESNGGTGNGAVIEIKDEEESESLELTIFD